MMVQHFYATMSGRCSMVKMTVITYTGEIYLIIGIENEFHRKNILRGVHRDLLTDAQSINPEMFAYCTALYFTVLHRTAPLCYVMVCYVILWYLMLCYVSLRCVALCYVMEDIQNICYYMLWYDVISTQYNIIKYLRKPQYDKWDTNVNWNNFIPWKTRDENKWTYHCYDIIKNFSLGTGQMAIGPPSNEYGWCFWSNFV